MYKELCLRSDEHSEELQMPEMMEPQRVLVMVPRDPPSRPAIAARATNMAGAVPGQAPGELEAFIVIVLEHYIGEIQ